MQVLLVELFMGARVDKELLFITKRLRAEQAMVLDLHITVIWQGRLDAMDAREVPAKSS